MRQREESKGFVSSENDQPEYVYCRDNDSVSVGTRASSGSEQAELRLLFRSNKRGCPRGSVERLSRSLIPPLEPPEDAEVIQGGGSGSRDYREARAELKTNLSAQVTLAHYAQQLEALGWVTTAGCFDGPLAVRSWSWTYEREPLNGTLLVIRDREVTYTTLRVQKQRDAVAQR